MPLQGYAKAMEPWSLVVVCHHLSLAQDKA